MSDPFQGFLLRPALLADLDAIFELATFLDSPNLPRDRDFLFQRLERAERAFAALDPPSEHGEYQFALEDAAGRVIGTCVILAKHGTPGMPHTYLELGHEERTSESAGVHAEHVTLRLRATSDGPTELGALILHPDARGAPGSPGKLLSWGRFAFIARHPECFEKELLAEMRAALDPEGRSAFWEAFGKRFTGMTYDEADRRSAHDKQFILDLFPDTTFYASLLPGRVAAQLGQVHEETLPAVRLLEKAGWRPIDQIDPFDAGPFFGCGTAETLPVRDTRSGRLVDADVPPDAPRAIVSCGAGAGFRAVVSSAALVDEGLGVALPGAARERLGLDVGADVSWTPLPPPTPRVSGRRRGA